MEIPFTAYIILIVFAFTVLYMYRQRRKYSVKKMIAVAARNNEFVFLHLIEKEKPSYFGCAYDVLISNQDNVQLIYKLYVYEGGSSHEIVSIMCTGFQSYTLVYKDGQICSDTLPGINTTIEDCEEILALARFAFQHALHTYQTK